MHPHPRCSQYVYSHSLIYLYLERIVVTVLHQERGVIGKAPASLFNFPSFWPRQAGLFPLNFPGKNEALFTLFNHSMYKKFHFGACSVMSTSIYGRSNNMAAIMAAVSTLTSNFLLLISQKLQEIKLIHF